MSDPFRTSLLLSMPQLQDPNFARTVVLLCDYGPDGAFGLVLNRPTDAPATSMVRLEPPVVGRASRRLRHFPLTPEVRIFPDDKGTHYILEMVAGDRPGLLGTIAYTLARANVNVVSAKINTLGERAEDVFYITDSDGRILSDEACRRVHDSLIRALDRRN